MGIDWDKGDDNVGEYAQRGAIFNVRLTGIEVRESQYGPSCEVDFSAIQNGKQVIGKVFLSEPIDEPREKNPAKAQQNLARKIGVLKKFLSSFGITWAEIVSGASENGKPSLAACLKFIKRSNGVLVNAAYRNFSKAERDAVKAYKASPAAEYVAPAQSEIIPCATRADALDLGHEIENAARTAPWRTFIKSATPGKSTNPSSALPPDGMSPAQVGDDDVPF